jgi:hypothetical protein
MKSQALFIAQPKYETKTWDDLPLAAEAASTLAVDLAARSYELGYQDLLSGGDKQAIEKAVDDWFTHVADGSYVLLVWTGHGYTDGVKHYLICRSSPRNGISGFNAIDTGAVGAVIANCKAEKILVVLDTCYSGLGVGDSAENLGKILATRTQVAGQQ